MSGLRTVAVSKVATDVAVGTAVVVALAAVKEPCSLALPSTRYPAGCVQHDSKKSSFR